MFKLGSAPKIQDLFGRVQFTQQEISFMQVRKLDRKTDRYIHRDRKTDRHRDRKIDRHRDRKTDI